MGSQIKSDLHEIFRVHSCGCSKMIKIKKTNRSTNKQTNKQTNKHVLDLEYLSQIKSDLHENFRVYFCGCHKIIKIKNEQVKNKQINIFKILSISAKSSQIFIKFSGELFLGVP